MVEVKVFSLHGDQGVIFLDRPTPFFPPYVLITSRLYIISIRSQVILHSEDRGGLACLTSFQRLTKWIAASINAAHASVR